MAKTKATKTKTPPAPVKLTKQADPFKRFHLAVAIAPAFVAEFLRRGNHWTHEDTATSIVQLADAIARRLESQKP